MTTLIILVTFVIVPFITSVALVCHFDPEEVELAEPSCIAWHEEVPSSPALNSFDLLLGDMASFGLGLTGYGYSDLSDPDCPTFAYLTDLSVDVNVSAFDDGCNNDDCPMQMIFEIDDAYVSRCLTRDGLATETVVEYEDAQTALIAIMGEEASDDDILGLLSPPAEEISLSMEPLDPETFVEESEIELSVDEWLENEENRLFCLAATESH